METIEISRLRACWFCLRIEWSICNMRLHKDLSCALEIQTIMIHDVGD